MNTLEQRIAQRARARARMPEKECPICGNAYRPAPTNPGQPTCSLPCGNALKAFTMGTTSVVLQYGKCPCSTVLIAPLGRPLPEQCRVCRAKALAREMPTPSTPLQYYTCITCSTGLVAPRRGKVRVYCSPRCSRKASKRKRRDAGTTNTQRTRLRIFTRDKWTCRLCGKKVQRYKAVPHPRAPTLDHVIPVSLGGSDGDENLQCAHFYCNVRKGNRANVNGEQLRLIG